MDALVVLAGIGLGATIAQWLVTKPALADASNVALAIGELSGLVAGYLALLGLLLAARVPVLETTLGLDRLLATHRRLGPWVLATMVVHATMVTLAYAARASTGVGAQLWLLVTGYEHVWLAALGLTLMLTAGIASWRRIRARLRYEVWWLLHLGMYAGIAAAFLHQISNGAAFIGHPLARAAWIAYFVVVFGCVAVFRIGLPVARAMRHKLRVSAVVAHAPGLVSVVIEGAQLDRLPLAGGQYALWRFLTPTLWWQAHPYSLSALVRDGRIRLTVRTAGDHGAALAQLAVGTRVLMEGPYGAFTSAAREPGRRVLLVAGGVGVAPIRTLLEDLPRDAAPVVLYRVRSEQDIVFRDELEWLLAKRRGSVHYLVGSRDLHPVDAGSLRRLVPDVRHRSVYACGPATLMAAVVAATQELGIPRSRVHLEAFDFHAADR